MTKIDHYFKSILLANFLILMFACSSDHKQLGTVENQSDKSNVAIANVEIDSLETFIMDSAIYHVMSCLFDELGGDFDSNVISIEAIVPEFDYLGFSYDKPNELDDLFRSAFMGEGTILFYLPSEDSIHIRNQIEENQNKRWLTDHFRGIAYDSLMLSTYENESDFDWERFKDDGFGCFESYSIPIFNKDSTKCIIQLNSYCHDLLASGNSFFMEKKKGLWKLVGRKQDWMS